MTKCNQAKCILHVCLVMFIPMNLSLNLLAPKCYLLCTMDMAEIVYFLCILEKHTHKFPKFFIYWGRVLLTRLAKLGILSLFCG